MLGVSRSGAIYLKRSELASRVKCMDARTAQQHNVTLAGSLLPKQQSHGQDVEQKEGCPEPQGRVSLMSLHLCEGSIQKLPNNRECVWWASFRTPIGRTSEHVGGKACPGPIKA